MLRSLLLLTRRRGRCDMSGLGDFCLDDDAIVVIGELVRPETIVDSGSHIERWPGHQVYRYQLIGSFR